MIEAVFISDLHLSPDEPEISQRFDAFLAWAETATPVIYILGDFFHLWAGDDAMDDWCKEIAKKLKKLSDKGILLYYMHGNRDFLLGRQFAELAGWQPLNEPAVIYCSDEPVLLVHGDAYCTLDKAHQRFRRLTRNRWFKALFLALPLSLRLGLVDRVRQHSQRNRSKPMASMDVVDEAVLAQMDYLKVRTLVHGHTHRSGLTVHQAYGREYYRYVLSDWDDRPEILCYDDTNGFYFKHYCESL